MLLVYPAGHLLTVFVIDYVFMCNCKYTVAKRKKAVKSFKYSVDACGCPGGKPDLALSVRSGDACLRTGVG